MLGLNQNLTAFNFRKAHRETSSVLSILSEIFFVLFQARDIQEFIPLINQIISRFKVHFYSVFLCIFVNDISALLHCFRDFLIVLFVRICNINDQVMWAQYFSFFVFTFPPRLKLAPSSGTFSWQLLTQSSRSLANQQMKKMHRLRRLPKHLKSQDLIKNSVI